MSEEEREARDEAALDALVVAAFVVDETRNLASECGPRVEGLTSEDLALLNRLPPNLGACIARNGWSSSLLFGLDGAGSQPDRQPGPTRVA
jgi:hypothetical protein